MPRAKIGKRHESDLGALIRRTRVEKKISQTELGHIFTNRLGIPSGNARISCFELGKAIPSDAELTILSQTLGLSVVSLREKRDVAAKQAAARRDAGRARGAEKLRLIRAGKRATKNANAAQAPQARAGKAPAKPNQQNAAHAPALADFVELVDGLAPMPTEKSERKLWFAATLELFKIGQSA